MSRASKFSLALALGIACAGARFAVARADTSGVAATSVDDARPDANSPAPQTARSGAANPLWAIPLDSLAATRERPLFSVSRRPPPAPVVAAAPVIEAPPPPPPPSEPENPQMTLVGVVHGADQDIGIFVNQMDQSVLRLRLGQEDHGWTVHSVDVRAATLEKDSQQVKLELPSRNVTPPAGPEVAVNIPPAPPPPPLVRSAIRKGQRP
jgi:general secretion pathway protein N